MRRLAIVAARCAREDAGFTLIEVLTAIIVLAIGLVAVFQMLIVATHATATNRIRQAETSLARELTEDTRSLGYGQLTASGIAAALQPQVSGATVSGSGLLVTRSASANSSGPSTTTFNATFTACSLDDPSDGYGSHSSPPVGGGSWCTDVAASGTQDPNPDDYKRVSVIVAPTGARTTPTVQQTILVYAKATHGPAVTCLTTNANCPGANLTITTGTSQLFNVTTTTLASSIEWLVNGSLPIAAQIPAGASDPYIPSGTTSQFTWNFPIADGTYTIAVLGFDVNGNTGTKSTLQVSLNRHMVIPPATVHAGWNQQIQGVDVQWIPSIDQDVLYYRVYHQIGSTTSVVAGCSQVTGLTCTDLSAPSPGAEPTTCVGTPGSTQSFTTPNLYWVVGVDTSPGPSPPAGQPRESTNLSAKVDANLCDHPPSIPTGLGGVVSGGVMTLNWATPPTPSDQDPGDSIQQWRIYRWPSGNASFPGSRLDLIGELTSTQQVVTSYADRSADPGGVPQNYCITAVDTSLNESSCSTVVTG
jgi:prepilin-type N-terminal cleavage/methylation domain-containing protein